MTQLRAEGWAVIEDDQLKVRSIQDTRRGAIVNFLVAERGVMVWFDTTDDQIESWWAQQRDRAEVVQIDVCVKEDA